MAELVVETFNSETDSGSVTRDKFSVREPKNNSSPADRSNSNTVGAHKRIYGDMSDGEESRDWCQREQCLIGVCGTE